MDLLQDNYSTLLIAIFCNCSIETAFRKLDNPNSKKPAQLTQNDVEDMYKLKLQGLTYKEIGEIYYIDQHVVFKRIKRYKEKNKGGMI
ncbi:hypothetical protein [Natronincola peptidivorans]|uniref:hypothetical protein n=1 Tax=Natronincola peptidivorans TaxID=426128 RepID=UPI000B86C60D|nr:hypothetical protein [Natronincola peptidivorans]